jgi:hypothetical protein
VAEALAVIELLDERIAPLDRELAPLARADGLPIADASAPAIVGGDDVGGRLVERLRADGREVRALARDPSRFAPIPGVDVARGDLLRRESLAARDDDAAEEPASPPDELVVQTHRNFRRRGGEIANHIQAGAIGHQEIDDQQIERPFREEPSPFL